MLLFLIILLSVPAYSQGLVVITATTTKEGEFSFANSLEEIQEGENGDGILEKLEKRYRNIQKALEMRTYQVKEFLFILAPVVPHRRKLLQL